MPIFQAFSSFPDTTFIWKYEDPTDHFSTVQAAKVPNVVLAAWIPQLDLLADHRLSLFISHGGMASCHELATFGVPALFVPIFGDQIRNAVALAHNGVAEVYDKYEINNADKLKAEIGKMLSNTSYMEAADRLREQLAARPSTPAQRLVSHVEFAARFGPSKSLRPLSLDLSRIQFWGIDLILIAVGSLVIVTVSVFSLIRFLFS
ncbi:hypothetical protein PMAYCL1PPCAC_19177, partial [Pristionchus mayeri]